MKGLKSDLAESGKTASTKFLCLVINYLGLKIRRPVKKTWAEGFHKIYASPMGQESQS